MRAILGAILLASCSVTAALTQTSSSPSSAPAAAGSPASNPAASPTNAAANPARSAAPSGAPTLAPLPGPPTPSGVIQPRTPPINSTPSQANTDKFPPSRVDSTPQPNLVSPNPGSETPAPAQSATDTANPPSSSGRPPPGGANSSPNAAAVEKRTGKNPINEAVADCMRLWDAGTHMSKGQWEATCRRVQTRLNTVTVESLAETSPVAPKRSRSAEQKRQGETR